MMTSKLYQICKAYADKINVGMPLTVENVMNAVVDWVGETPVDRIDVLKKELDQINAELPNLSPDYAGYKIVVNNTGTAMRAEEDLPIETINLAVEGVILSLTYDTVYGISMTTEGRITYQEGGVAEAQVEQVIPIIAGDGISIDATEDNKKIEIKAVERLPATPKVFGSLTHYMVRSYTDFFDTVSFGGVVAAQGLLGNEGQVLTATADGSVEWKNPQTGIVDSEPTQDSANPVSSGGVYTALQGKLDSNRNAVATVGGLVKPVTTPTSTELVGISTGMEQERVKIGSGLSYDTSTKTLTATGGGAGGSKFYVHRINISETEPEDENTPISYPKPINLTLTLLTGISEHVNDLNIGNVFRNAYISNMILAYAESEMTGNMFGIVRDDIIISQDNVISMEVILNSSEQLRIDFVRYDISDEVIELM